MIADQITYIDHHDHGRSHQPSEVWVSHHDGYMSMKTGCVIFLGGQK